jgi:ferredoxin-NADP reductase
MKAVRFDIVQRVTKVDISILQNCHRFKIPALIVRSKADNHIRQTMKDLGYSKIRKAEKDEIHAKARSKFISETRLNFEESLREAGIQDQDVYIISSETLYETVTGGRELKTIDEEKLMEEIFKAASNRQYGDLE